MNKRRPNAQAASFRSREPRKYQSNILYVPAIQNKLFRAARYHERRVRLWCSRCETLELDMLDVLLKIAEFDERIANARENLRGLMEQAAVYSGAADEELTSRRIAEQEAELERLTKQRDELLKSLSTPQAT